jgi:hypothetical protein
MNIRKPGTFIIRTQNIWKCWIRIRIYRNEYSQPWQNDIWTSTTSEACGASSRILHPPYCTYIMNTDPQPWQKAKWTSTSEACGASSRILNPQNPGSKHFGNAGSGSVYNEYRYCSATLTEMDINLWSLWCKLEDSKPSESGLKTLLVCGSVYYEYGSTILAEWQMDTYQPLRPGEDSKPSESGLKTLWKCWIRIRI